MPRRNIKLANNEYYHIYNRSSGAIDIFKGVKNIKRFLSLLEYYRFPQNLKFSKFNTLSIEDRKVYERYFRKIPKIIELYAYAIMPNHYHLLVRQTENNGIIKSISNIQNGFAKYYNIRHERFGSLFQGPFKSKRIEKEEYLLHLSRYIHLNPVTSYLIETDKLPDYHLTSFPIYLKKRNNKNDLVNTNLITSIIGSKEKYKKFVFNRSDYQMRLKKIEGLTIEK